ncbi:hypothetical protein LCGC14_1922850, partial [marine sediment metagenome]
MSKYTRFLFGWDICDKVDIREFITLQTNASPVAIAGKLAFNGTNFKLCEDGTNFETFTLSSSSSSSS